MVHSVSIAVAATLFYYAHDYDYQKATTISNFFAPMVELFSYREKQLFDKANSYSIICMAVTFTFK